MPRPTSKSQLLEAIRKERDALEAFLEGLATEEMLQPGIVGQWSVKDVLAHLVEWEQMFLGWYRTGLQGQLPDLPAKGFNWRQLPALNEQIYQRHRDQSLTDVLKQFTASHQELVRTLQAMSEQELCTPDQFAWTKPHPLMTYILPNTSSHYRWAKTVLHKGFQAKSKIKPKASGRAE
jgi:uncharacterized protein (TIGR03083 family)